MLQSELFFGLFYTAISLTLVATVLSRLKVPTIVGFVLTGIIIGPSALHLVSSLPAAQTISEVGIIFLMFSLGLEISLVRLKAMIRPLLSLGLAQVGATILTSAVLFSYAFKFDLGKSFVFGSLLSLSSTAVVFKLLQDKRESESPYGRMSVIILLFQDIAALPLMIALPLLSASSTMTATHSIADLAMVVLWIVSFLTACFILGYFVIPRLFSYVVATQSREVFFFSIISMTFVFAVFAEEAGLSLSLGAFVAGVLISESPYSKQALAELSPLRDIFLGFFFASVGMLIDLKFVLSNLLNFLWLVPMLNLLKFSVIYCVGRINRNSHGVSFASALSLNQIGEFSFILGAAALGHGLISDIEFQYFLALSVLSLLFTPFMFSMAVKASAHSGWKTLARTIQQELPNAGNLLRIRGKVSEIEGNSNQPSIPAVSPRKALVVGLGHAGRKTLAALNDRRIPCVGVDFNGTNIQEVASQGIEVVFGDATRPEVLESAGINDAFLVVISVTGKSIASRVLAVVRSMNPTVKVILRAHFLTDVEDQASSDQIEVIISEAETARVIFEKALAHYGFQN